MKKSLMKRHRFLVLLSLFTPIALLLAFWSGGYGHGDYLASKLLFPFPMALAIVSESISPLSLLIALIQFPVYGYLIDRRNLIVICGLLAAHVIIVIGITFYNGYF